MFASEIRPGIEVLLTSGYAEDLVLDDDPKLARLKILQALPASRSRRGHARGIRGSRRKLSFS